MQSVRYVFALLMIEDQSSAPKNFQMMRHIGQLVAQQDGKFGNILGAGLKAFDDPQSLGVGERFEVAGT
jgi:hypothetical protein